MTLCILKNGAQCHCQPSEGITCVYQGDLERDAFERGRDAGKHEAALETRYGSFRAHVQAVIGEARKVRDALEGDKLVDGLGAALSAHDDFLTQQKRTGA